MARSDPEWKQRARRTRCKPRYPRPRASWWRRLFCALGGHGTIHSGYARQRWRPSCLRCGARFSQTHGVSI